MEPLFARYFEAGTSEEIASAEAQILGASAGSIDTAYAILPAYESPASEATAGDGDEARWLSRFRVAPGGLRSTERFGPLGSPLRGDRIGHILFDLPVPHPRVANAFVSLVPVLPPATRPPIFADGCWGAPHTDRLYAEIARRAALLKYGDEALEWLKAPLARLFDGWQRRDWSSWTPADEPSRLAPEMPEMPEVQPSTFASEDVVAIRFVDSDVLALAFPSTVVLVRWRDGEITSAVASRTATLLAVDAKGRAQMLGCAPTGESIAPKMMAVEAMRQLADRFPDLPPRDEALFTEYPDEAPEYADRVFSLDLHTGRWGGSPPDDFPAVWFSEALERSYLYRDDGSSTELIEVGDYPTIEAFSPDRRFAWIEDKHGGGAVFRARDAAVATLFRGDRHELSEDTLSLARGGRASAIGDPDEWRDSIEDDDDARASAIVRLPSGVWQTIDAGVVARDDAPVFALGFGARCAAFDREGALLVFADGSSIGVIAITNDGPRLLASWPIARFTERRLPIR